MEKENPPKKQYLRERAGIFLNTDLPMLPILVSLVAVILSQLPPLYSLVAKPELDAELGPQILLQSNQDELSITPFLSIINVGKAPAWIRSMDLFVTHKDGKHRTLGTLPIQTYLPDRGGDPVKSGAFVVARFIELQPDTSWNYFVTSYRDFQPDQNARYVLAEKELKLHREGRLAGGSEKLKHTIEEVFSKKTIGVPHGIYHVLLSANDRDGSTLIQKAYSFEILEDDARKLFDRDVDTGDLRTVFEIIANGRRAFMWRALTPIDDDATLKSLVTERESLIKSET